MITPTRKPDGYILPDLKQYLSSGRPAVIFAHRTLNANIPVWLSTEEPREERYSKDDVSAEAQADRQTKEELLRRMRSFVEAEAKRRDVPEWSVVGHIFGTGSGVSSALWSDFISKEKEPVGE